jgi:hypothetical protein
MPHIIALFTQMSIMAVGWAASFMLGRRQFLLFVERQSTKQSFLRRKKDDVLLVIISATVGALLTLLGTWMLGGFR